MVKTELLALLVPVLPLAGSLAIGFGRNRLKGNSAGLLGTALVAVSFVCSLLLFLGHDGTAHIVKAFNWIDVGGMHIPFAFQIDTLSLWMMLIVTGIGSLIHLYSIGYMHDDPRVASFFAQLNLFTFSMLLLVMGSNFLVTFIGWEGVGLCSYLLIGFWYTNPDFNYAGRKAFVMNRIGDIGMVLAMTLMFLQFGTLNYAEITAQAGSSFSTGNPLIVGATLLLFLGATGKSAQLPLLTWLPDAMAGPTPVSALIHAATMVTAGIFLVVRSSVLFELAPYTQDIILWVGVATALFGATVGLFQNDIKKVLAYSTVSQLGYMFAALGVGAYSWGMFHVTTHAFFKALLFLGAGSVIHALGGEQDIRKMGGLKNTTKTTYVTFLIATLAIAGIPPLSGFFSKDGILASTFAESPAAYAVLVFAAMLTAFYMFRLLFLTFFGTYRGKAHPHESPKVMTVPLMVLAVLSAIGGLLNIPHVFGGHEWLKGVLAKAADAVGAEHLELSASTEWTLMALGTGLVLLTIWYTWTLFGKKTTLDGEPADMPFLKRLIARRWLLDELYAALFEKPFGWLSRNLFGIGETKVAVPLTVGTGKTTLGFSELLRKLQTGNTSFYLFGMMVGVVVLLLITMMG
ncbi:MAG: NADH-quinone oxidoreductase subunit L [Bacteroidetes bacterium]|nr:NADH-quinone oxidoreductase subunit L [Bacteroidota bacterium]MBS1943444.1 NADH-quinone oxidoreductase subunit L [Bacteroidota bacterium]